MAAPVSEQSDFGEGTEASILNNSNSKMEEDKCESMDSEVPNKVIDGVDSAVGVLSSNPTPSTSDLHAFHVVSFPDGHKEVTSDMFKTTELAMSDHDSSLKPAEEVLQAKQFSAQVIQQESKGEECEDKMVEERMNTLTANLTGADSNEDEDKKDKDSMDGVNIEEIDEAVERALLGEDDKDVDMSKDCNNEIESFNNEGKESSMSQVIATGEQNDAVDKTPHRVVEKVLNIDEETRMGLDQTPVQDQTSMGSSFTYPSLPPRKLFQLDENTKDSEASDSETKLSATMTDTEDIRLRNTIGVDETTNASDSNTDAPTPSQSSRKQWKGNREGIGIPKDEEGKHRVFTASDLFEYRWPLDGGDWHMLQEQVSEYLDIKSFKRKYPDLERRVCDKEEKDFLRDKGVVSETQSDLGLTALRSEDVYDLMMKDYNKKYQDYITHLQEKQKKGIREKHKEYSEQAKVDKSKAESYSKKAARSAAEYNANMMREKREERRAYFDLQTYTIQFPKNKYGHLHPHLTKVGAYPVAVLAGQYQDNYKRYTQEQLKNFPVKTVMLDPVKPAKYVRPMPESVRLAILEKQKAPPPPPVEETMEVQDASVLDGNVENKENAGNVDADGKISEQEIVGQAVAESTVPILTHYPSKFVMKHGSKSTGKKRPKIELSPERPRKFFKKYRESMPGGVSDLNEDSKDGEDSNLSNPSDLKSLIPKIHGLEKCRICKQRSTKEERLTEKIVKCAHCCKIGHTSCLDLTEELVAVIKTYPWQCMECKTCVKCLDPFDEDKMMFCDRCDRGFHTFCIGLDALPTGHWECGNCETGHTVVMRPKTKVAETANEASASAEVTTIETKKELIEGEEMSTTPGTPVESSSAAISTPKVYTGKKRGRKRKYPLDPNKPIPESASKPSSTLTGERQSRRLKIKVEEEDEKKRTEIEEKERLKEEKLKEVRKMAAEAAKASAIAAASTYADLMEKQKKEKKDRMTETEKTMKNDDSPISKVKDEILEIDVDKKKENDDCNEENKEKEEDYVQKLQMEMKAEEKISNEGVSSEMEAEQKGKEEGEAGGSTDDVLILDEVTKVSCEEIVETKSKSITDESTKELVSADLSLDRVNNGNKVTEEQSESIPAAQPTKELESSAVEVKTEKDYPLEDGQRPQEEKELSTEEDSSKEKRAENQQNNDQDHTEIESDSGMSKSKAGEETSEHQTIPLVEAQLPPAVEEPSLNDVSRETSPHQESNEQSIEPEENKYFEKTSTPASQDLPTDTTLSMSQNDPESEKSPAPDQEQDPVAEFGETTHASNDTKEPKRQVTEVSSATIPETIPQEDNVPPTTEPPQESVLAATSHNDDVSHTESQESVSGPSDLSKQTLPSAEPDES